MYSYTYDKQTGGLLLNSSPTGFSKEPRPVYSPELDVLGFDKYWKYDKQTALPYMWAEANQYWYRGRLVASLKGGNVYTAPEIQLAYVCDEWREKPTGKAVTKTICDLPSRGETIADKKGNIFTLNPPEPNGNYLRSIDIKAMVEANSELLEIVEQTTVKKILAIYTKHKDALDCFHVAFSGGKDSCVLLDLVKKALPRGSFVVVFGDTGMEFPDTYEIIEKTKQQCSEDEIPFYIAESHLTPKESWELFGPPSRVLRWCCSVHKSTPQTLKLREITGKHDYTGLAFVGVRAQESATRAEYDYFNDGKKIKGQLSHNSILEWTSAEVWLYIYANDIILNEAYKKGSARVGCICCPMGGGKAGFIEHENYTHNVSDYFEIIKKSNGRKIDNLDEYVKSGGWGARKNGRDLANNPNCCTERFEYGYLTITVDNPTSDWREWIKTLELPIETFSVTETNTGYVARLLEEVTKQTPILSRLFRQVFHKAACCKGCRVCETNCRNECITFEGGLRIDSCIQCKDCNHCKKKARCKKEQIKICVDFEHNGIRECHAIDSGCLRYHSLRHPQGGGTPMKTLNTMSNHAPKTEWLRDFFERKDKFFIENSLNKKNQVGPFCRFLRDARLIDKMNHVTSLVDITNSLGWMSDTAQGLILLNLVAENPQIKWYVENLELGRSYPKKDVVEMLLASGVEPSKSGKFDAHDSICYAFKRLIDTPLGTVLRFGYITDEGELVRTKCSVSDPRVVLYGLFKFAEKCNDYKEFTLATLLNDSIDRDGISPTRIFGFDREDMIPILLGLSAKYPGYITASFTHDLEKITLAQDKSSGDVLELFKGDNGYA